MQFGKTFIELALRYVLINLSVVFLTESFFFHGAECKSSLYCIRERGGRNKLYLYGNVLVNY